MRLKSISFLNNQFFQNKKIKFTSDDEDSDKNNYITIIIGPNGTGKSLLLREIIRMFKDTRARQNGPYEKKVLEYKYELNYISDSVNYKVEETNTGRKYFINEKTHFLKEWYFPRKIVALSTILNDKFIYSKNEDDFYQYCGIRSSNNNAGTKTSTKTLVNNLYSVEYLRINYFSKILEKLNFEKSFIIYFNLKQKTVLYSLKSVSDLDNYFIHWNKRSKRKTEPFSTSYYKKLSLSQKRDILSFIQKIKNEQALTYELFDKNEYLLFKNRQEIHENLLKLDLLEAPYILFMKNKEYYQESFLSSGEYNILIQFIKILLALEDNSLLLIDEPEVSLHPNWQINYLSILSLVTQHFKGIHTIITTHSNLLVSNLNQENSSLIVVSNDSDFELLDYSVSGWSPENILYRVFNTTSSRNYYFEMDLRKLISFLECNDSDLLEVKDIVNRLEKFKLTKDDPLFDLLQQVMGKIENDNF